MWRLSPRPSPRPGIAGAGAALLGAALAAATAQAQDRPARRELTAADAMALRTPAVADKLGLSDEQRRRVQALIRDHADEFARLHQEYPRGEQDSEGEDLRRQAVASFDGLMAGTTAGLLDVLEPNQRDALRRLPPADFSGKDLPGVIEPFPRVPPFFDRLGLTQQQWRDFDHLGSPTAGLPAVAARLSPGERRELAGLIRQRFDDHDRAARRLLTQEQRLILDQMRPGRRDAGGPRFRVLAGLWPGPRGIASLRLAELPDPRLSLDVEGCFARLVRKGEADRDVLVHPPDYLVTGHAFSPAGKFLATVASTFPRRPESRLRVWEVSTGKPVAQFLSESEITEVAFADDSVLVLSASPMNGR
jgi:hypothetical protein